MAQQWQKFGVTSPNLEVWGSGLVQIVQSWKWAVEEGFSLFVTDTINAGAGEYELHFKFVRTGSHDTDVSPMPHRMV